MQDKVTSGINSNASSIGTQPRSRYIFVTGGVMSGLGKGVVTASIAKLLQLCNLRVSCMKIDPYLNVDAGTMNPMIHGEVFVTEDGGECDMDIGAYERFLDTNLSRDHNITTGKVYSSVIERERKGEYLGQCVQIIPHVTDEIKARIRGLAAKHMLDVLVVECGGTVGDIESLPFLEAMRQIRLEDGAENVLFVHVTLAPVLDVVGEVKTKPTQHSVQELRRIGIQPDIIAVRSRVILDDGIKSKIALFANVSMRDVISCHDVDSIYEVPEVLQQQGIVDRIRHRLGLPDHGFEWGSWRQVMDSYRSLRDGIRIAMVGKYVKLADSYVSVNQALSHAGAMLGYRVRIDHIDAELFEQDSRNLSMLDGYSGILVPGGFGRRGSEGIIRAADYARVKDIPYLGICFGFQLAIVAFARSVCMLDGANSTELDEDARHPVVHLLPEQRDVVNLGGTMRLGTHEIDVKDGTLAYSIYGSRRIYKRHRHRYELNLEYRDILERHGMIFSGWSDGARRMEILELPDSRFYLAVQYHAEFTSRPGRPEEAFLAFVKAALEYSGSNERARMRKRVRGIHSHPSQSPPPISKPRSRARKV
ncbi:MAG: CTP synthase [Candidatus Nitrosocaldus sp.]|nr:CTP synthase [Candidatus Nitrosocaldus sp.]